MVLGFIVVPEVGQDGPEVALRVRGSPVIGAELARVRGHREPL